MNFLVYFNWSGDYTKTWQFSLLKPMYENRFAKLYNKACNALHPHYKDWNKEFDSLYPNRKMDIDGFDPLYVNYIRDKQNEFLSTLNSKLFKLFSGDECQICGKLNDFDAEVFITLVPHEDK